MISSSVLWAMGNVEKITIREDKLKRGQISGFVEVVGLIVQEES